MKFFFLLQINKKQLHIVHFSPIKHTKITTVVMRVTLTHFQETCTNACTFPLYTHTHIQAYIFPRTYIYNHTQCKNASIFLLYTHTHMQAYILYFLQHTCTGIHNVPAVLPLPLHVEIHTNKYRGYGSLHAVLCCRPGAFLQLGGDSTCRSISSLMNAP